VAYGETIDYNVEALSFDGIIVVVVRALGLSFLSLYELLSIDILFVAFQLDFFVVIAFLLARSADISRSLKSM
jgi:hypothetical protein